MTFSDDRVERDEFGIPVGEHTATCGCKFHGRSLLDACDSHKEAAVILGEN